MQLKGKKLTQNVLLGINCLFKICHQMALEPIYLTNTNPMFQNDLNVRNNTLEITEVLYTAYALQFYSQLSTIH